MPVKARLALIERAHVPLLNMGACPLKCHSLSQSPLCCSFLIGASSNRSSPARLSLVPRPIAAVLLVSHCCLVQSQLCCSFLIGASSNRSSPARLSLLPRPIAAVLLVSHWCLVQSQLSRSSLIVASSNRSCAARFSLVPRPIAALLLISHWMNKLRGGVACSIKWLHKDVLVIQKAYCGLREQGSGRSRETVGSTSHAGLEADLISSL